MSPSELLDLVARRARELREAGVKRLQLEEFVCVEFLPAPEQVVAEPSPQAEEEYSDPLKDPATFPGGRLPRFFHRLDNE